MNTEQAVQLLIALVYQAANLTKLIDQARAEGRDITDEEFASLRQQDDAARARLQAAIDLRS